MLLIQQYTIDYTLILMSGTDGKLFSVAVRYPTSIDSAIDQYESVIDRQ